MKYLLNRWFVNVSTSKQKCTIICTEIKQKDKLHIMTTFIATFHARKKEDIATVAFFLFVSVLFLIFMKYCMGHKPNLVVKQISSKDFDLMYQHRSLF